MTATQTTDLASLLSAKRADLAALPAPEANGVIDVEAVDAPPEVTEHGEIVPVAAAPPPVEYEPTYPTIPPKVVGGLPYVRDYMKLARTIHSTEMVPAAFKGRPEAILATFLRGYEMGFGPMQSLDSFNVIQGTVGLKPEAMRALIFDNGHQIILSDVVDADGNVTAITAACRRKDWPADTWASYTYSLGDARLAGLLGKDNWKKMPRAMLDARATAGAGRRYFADVLAGMSYTPEEIRDFSGPDREELPSHEPANPSPTPPATVPGSPEEVTDTSTNPPPESSPKDSPPSTAQPTSDIPQSQPAPSPTNQTKRTRKTKAEAEATDSDVRLETRKALTAIIAGLPANQQPLCRAFLAQRGYGDVTKLSDEGLQEAINIAAGWPYTAVVDVDDDGNAEDADVIQPELPDGLEEPF